MKSKSDLTKELNRNYNLKEKILLEIGSHYYNHMAIKDGSSLNFANEKSELLKKLNEKISELEKDFINASH
ncbi:MAG: hypothetical protein IPJ66_07480 [Bacteroidetes bacterium]|nr:hypothetical protein [Bacteroidota bacterium]MBL0063635.1 hypothetical protein [Bacteroidota bacterium]MBL0139937.1 hypothetical protein [Bacteroidota bacterium]